MTAEVDLLEGRTLLSIAPVTTANISGELGKNGFYTGPVTVNLTATEQNAPSSSLTTEFRVNNGPLMTGNQILLNQSGTDVVQYFSQDNTTGAVESTHTLTINIDLAGPRLTEMASPTTLWPPNHKFQTVTVSGRALDQFSGINNSSIRYFVRDEYGQVQPRGTAVVHANGTYSFQVQLQSSREGQDRDGRQYTIFVVAQSGAGQTVVRRAVVTVPHDQGHSHGSGSSSDDDDNNNQGDNDQGDNNQGDDDSGDNGSGNNKHGKSKNHGHGKGHGKGHGHGHD